MIDGARINIDFIRERRYPVFLDKNLYHVRQDLQESEFADTVRTEPVLPDTEKPALKPYEARRDGQSSDENAENNKKRNDNFAHIISHPRALLRSA